MIQRCLLLVAVCVFAAACSTAPDITPSTRLVTSSPIPGGSPEAATPTAIISRLAPPPSPSPSPSPAALASPSPVALGSPVPSPVASPIAATSGPRYSIVADQSEASYHARETLVSRGFPSDAVGTTKAITGDLQLESDGVVRGQVLNISVDLRTLASDDVRRDNFIRQNTLQTDRFPLAVFRSADSGGLPTSHPGEEVTFQLPGVMSLHGQDRPVTWDARARLEGDTLFGSATTRIKLSDFGIEPPRLAILSVEDEMTWTIDIVAQRQP